MKLMNKSIELLKTPLLIKISFLAFASFYLGKYFSNSQPLVFYSSAAAAVGDAGPAGLRSIAFSPNANLTLDASVLIPKQTLTLTLAPSPLPPAAPPPPPILSSPPPPFRFGIVAENGTMRDDFEVGEFDPNLVERWDFGNDTSSGSEGKVGGARVRVRKYRFCDGS